MRTISRVARAKKPKMFASLSGFLLFTTLMIPLAAHAQASPFVTGFTALQTLFTGTVAKVASLIAIVIGGYVVTLAAVNRANAAFWAGSIARMKGRDTVEQPERTLADLPAAITLRTVNERNAEYWGGRL